MRWPQASFAAPSSLLKGPLDLIGEKGFTQKLWNFRPTKTENRWPILVFRRAA